MKKNLRTERIHLRVSPKEKSQIQKNADELSMDLSDYMRMSTIYKLPKSNTFSILDSLTQLQNLYNKIEDTYGKDPTIEKELDKIWKKL